MKSTKKQKPSCSPTQTGATKHSRTNNRTPVLSSSGQSNNAIAQSQSCWATVQTEEEDIASHGEDVEVIEVDASEPDVAKESSSESEEEASEDELG